MKVDPSIPLPGEPGHRSWLMLVRPVASGPCRFDAGRNEGVQPSMIDYRTICRLVLTGEPAPASRTCSTASGRGGCGVRRRERGRYRLRGGPSDLAARRGPSPAVTSGERPIGPDITNSILSTRSSARPSVTLLLLWTEYVTTATRRRVRTSTRLYDGPWLPVTSTRASIRVRRGPGRSVEVRLGRDAMASPTGQRQGDRPRRCSSPPFSFSAYVYIEAFTDIRLPASSTRTCTRSSVRRRGATVRARHLRTRVSRSDRYAPR